MFTRFTLVIATAALAACPAAAHYHLLLPATRSVEPDQPIQVMLAWGHPFEHQLFDAAKPARLAVIGPDGTATDLTPRLSTTRFGGKSGPAAFAVSFTPARRGDYLFVADAEPVWMAEEGLFFHDQVKVVVHVATQVGWDRAAGGPLELVPLTRPYGLEPHVAFQAQAVANRKPAAGVVAEVERYNEVAPAEGSLPPDEQITRRVKADPNGVLTATLHDAGWWAITAISDGGTRDHDAKPRPVRRRATLWVHVDPKAAGGPK
jgi:cobalt/nickel transport protein